MSLPRPFWPPGGDGPEKKRPAHEAQPLDITVVPEAGLEPAQAFTRGILSANIGTWAQLDKLIFSYLNQYVSLCAYVTE